MEERFFWGPVRSVSLSRKITGWSGGIFAACSLLIVLPFLLLLNDLSSSVVMSILVTAPFFTLSLALAFWRNAWAAVGLLLLCLPALLLSASLSLTYLAITDRDVTADGALFHVATAIFMVLIWLAWRGFIAARAYARLSRLGPKPEVFD